MGATKMHFYTEHQIEMAKLCKALGHPARIAIIEKLIEDENLNCTDLRYFVPLAQSTISRHLKELFDAGIVGYKVIGNNCYYFINSNTINHVIEYLAQIKINTNEQINYDSVYFRPRIKHQRPYFMRI